MARAVTPSQIEECCCLSTPINEKLRFCGPATVGATKLLGLVGLLTVTIGSPGLTTCAHWNGPVGGVLAVPSSVTVMPRMAGSGSN